jgi:hypothetical protein
MKLRLLNWSHSCIAYLGYLSGHETVAETMRDPEMLRFVREFMDEEVTPALVSPLGADVVGYKRALIEQFCNPALRHQAWQIAMDGSQKLPQRWLGQHESRFRKIDRYRAWHWVWRPGCAMWPVLTRRGHRSTCATLSSIICGAAPIELGPLPNVSFRPC